MRLHKERETVVRVFGTGNIHEARRLCPFVRATIVKSREPVFPNVSMLDDVDPNDCDLREKRITSVTCGLKIDYVKKYEGSVFMDGDECVFDRRVYNYCPQRMILEAEKDGKIVFRTKGEDRIAILEKEMRELGDLDTAWVMLSKDGEILNYHK